MAMTSPVSDEGATAFRARLAAIVESSDDAIVSKDLNGIITSWNPAAERMFGYTAAEAVGQSITLIIPPELFDEEADIIGRIRAGLKVDPFETLRRRKSGELINISLTVSPIRDGQGTVIGASKIARDISEQTRTREQLELATSAAEMGLWDVDIVGDTLYWDARCKAMFGISADAPVTMTDFYSGLHPADRDTTTAAFVAALDPARRALYDVEYRTIGKEDGVLRWIAAKGRGLFDRNGRCVRALGTTIDITARKHTEIRLRELNESLERRIAEALAGRKLLADIVESTDAFVQVVGLDFNWLAINRAAINEFERIFGLRPQVGANMIDVLAPLPEHQAAVRAVWSRALAGEEFTEVGEFGEPDRDRRFYEMKYNTLRDADGAMIGAYQFVYDVTERLSERARLEEAEEHLRQAQKMEAVGQLTGGIAHDFNNMLAVVLGSLELVNRRLGGGDPRIKRQLDAATDAAKRAANLTQRLLAFSRQQPLKPERLHVNRLVTGMSDILHHSLGGLVRLETVLGAGLWPVLADPNQLESVILNLGVNARDAMPDGGKLTIETQNAHLDWQYGQKHLGIAPGQYVLIAVSDTGIGMTPEIAEKAFDPFFTTKEVGKGTGLGLSQVYGFIKQSGGHVKIYSELGQGTTVKIYLPRAAGGEMTTDNEAVAEPLPSGETREVILVVDDEPSVRQFSVDAVLELGYGVLEANGAEAALRLVESYPNIALLFTDIAMPDMNGRILADRALSLRPDLKVLYTTGYTRNAVVHNGVVDPGVELIGKPFTLEELAARLREILDRP